MTKRANDTLGVCALLVSGVAVGLTVWGAHHNPEPAPVVYTMLGAWGVFCILAQVWAYTKPQR